MRVMLVVNGSASSVTARKRVVIQRVLSGNNEVEVAETKRRGHATRLALAAARRGFDVVIALGGDGTLNEVANGLVGTDTALGLLPGGSTNVFARTLGLHEDPVQAALQLVDAIHEDSIVPISLGSANGRYFVFHVGMGWDAELVSQVERKATLKKYLNHVLFIYAGLVAFFKTTDRTQPWYTATCDNVPGESEGWLALCLNSNPYTFVGPRPFNVAPSAHLQGALTFVSVNHFSTGAVLKMIGQALGDGHKLAANADVTYSTEATAMTIVGHRPLPWQVDGDFLGHTDKVVVKHHPQAVRLLVPSAFRAELQRQALPSG